MITHKIPLSYEKPKSVSHYVSRSGAIINSQSLWNEIPIVPKVFEPLKFDCISRIYKSFFKGTVFWICHQEKFTQPTRLKRSVSLKIRM